MVLYNELLPEFRRYGAELLGISVDGAWCHLAFSRDRKLRFPLLSDFEPKGAVARAYGAYREQEGVSERALFVIDREGTICWSYVSPIDVNPGADGILAALEDLAAKQLNSSKRSEGMTAMAVSRLVLPVSERDHIRGPSAAPVTLVEYGDYECPHCGEAYYVVKELERLHGKHLRFVFRNFPISTAHPNAESAAEAAEAAGGQDKFWDMHDQLFENQQALERENSRSMRRLIGLDSSRFIRDMNQHRYAKRVREDFMSGVRSGVNGTPTFFVNGIRHDGSYELASLLAAVRRAGAKRVEEKLTCGILRARCPQTIRARSDEYGPSLERLLFQAVTTN